MKSRNLLNNTSPQHHQNFGFTISFKMKSSDYMVTVLASFFDRLFYWILRAIMHSIMSRLVASMVFFALRRFVSINYPLVVKTFVIMFLCAEPDLPQLARL